MTGLLVKQRDIGHCYGLPFWREEGMGRRGSLLVHLNSNLGGRGRGTCMHKGVKEDELTCVGGCVSVQLYVCSCIAMSAYWCLCVLL